MLPILALGFLVGMQHALEVDHVAAVSSIAAHRARVGDVVRHGLTWGLGHTITLLVFTGAAILVGGVISDSLAAGLETAVGAMLVALGGHVLWRLKRDRVHFHRHRHPDGTAHFHAHSHAGESRPHELSVHAHAHGLRWRTLAVGLMHGMAGSAALLVLAASQFADPLLALGYVLIFGVGSIIGMGALSTLIAVPLVVSARFLTWANRGLRVAIGAVTIGIGAATIWGTVA